MEIADQMKESVVKVLRNLQRNRQSWLMNWREKQYHARSLTIKNGSEKTHRKIFEVEAWIVMIIISEIEEIRYTKQLNV